MFHVSALTIILSIVGMAIPLTYTETPPSARPVLLVATDAPDYAPGSTITFSLAVDIPGDAPVTVEFSTAQLFDIAVFADEREVWRWSADRDFATVETERTFPPGVSLLGRVAWNGRDSAGVPLPAGTYRAVGTLTTMGAAQDGNVILVRLSDAPAVGH